MNKATVAADIPSRSLSFGPLRLPVDSEKISDCEEEIFFVYTQLQGAPTSEHDPNHGLGFVDSTKDILEIGFDLTPTTLDQHQQGTTTDSEGPSHRSPHSKLKRRHRKTASHANKPSLPERVELSLFQDPTSLRSRKGDTGSVVWKVSVELAKFVLKQHRFPVEKSFFDYDLLKDCHILELGSGTGILGVLLSPLVKGYIVTDVADVTPLILKNVAKSLSHKSGVPPNITVEPLDWIALHALTPPQRRRLFRLETPLDLVFAVDCIYHPSLIPPLLSTIDHFAISEKTAVLVVSELRSEEVLREFLTSWLSIPDWNVWHVGGDLLQDKRYVIWMGWKSRI